MSNPTGGLLLNSVTPAAPTGNQNAKPQSDNASPMQSITWYPQQATASLLGVVVPDGSTITVDGTGKISAAITASVTRAVIRGVSESIYTAGGGGTFTINLPTGTLEGDFALLHILSWSGDAVVPSGWSEIISDFPVSFVCAKILDSADIAAGSISPTGAIGSPGDIAQMVTLIGATGGVSQTLGSGNGSSAGTFTETVTTSSSTLSTDLAVLFSATGITTGGALSVSPGTVLQNPSTAAIMGLTASQAMSGGATPVVFGYTNTNNISVQHVIVVSGTPAPVVLSLVGGTPTTTPALGTAIFDPSTNDLWIYGDAGWKSVTLT
jgi:hypothetical protein